MFISNSLWFSFTLERLLTYSLSKPLSTIIPSFYFWQTHISEIAYFAISKYDYENFLQNFPMFCIYFQHSEAIHRGNEPFLILNLIACNNLNVRLPSFYRIQLLLISFVLVVFHIWGSAKFLNFLLAPVRLILFPLLLVSFCFPIL